jgi:catechol 2,3-dioxygenase-like lactoylglutathione lyase family enzyme
MIHLVLVFGAVLAPGVPAGVDHVMLGIRDLEEGIRLFEERTGVRPVAGGNHPGRSTRNALVSLGPRFYVEIIAPQASAKRDAPDAAGLFGLTTLTPLGWAVGVSDVEGARLRLIAAGFEVSPGRPGSRAKPDGSTLEWITFGVTRPQLPGVPFFIRWGDRVTHPSQDSPSGCRMKALSITSPAAGEVRRVLSTLAVVEVPVEQGDHGGLALTLACPRGAVRFSTP